MQPAPADLDALGGRTADSDQMIRRFVDILAKRRFVIFSVFSLVVAAGVAYTLRQPKIYRATATIVIDSATPQVLGTQFRDVVDVEMGNWWSAREYLLTQHNVIRSEQNAYAVVDRLQREGKLTRLFPRVTSREEIADRLRTAIVVEPVKDSRIVEIQLTHTTRAGAAELANTVAEVYIEENLAHRLDSTRGAASWLSAQLADIKKKLESSEMALHEFKAANNILSVGLEDRQNITSNEVVKLSDALTEAKTKRIALEARRKQIMALRSGDALTDASMSLGENEMFAKLKTAYAEQYEKIVELEGKYLEQHPAVQAARARLTAIRDEIQREATLATKSLDAEYNTAIDTERSLAAAVASVTTQALDLNRKEIDYNRLLRNRENNAKIYELLLGRMKESDLAAQLRTNNVRTLDVAKPPLAPISPNLPLNIGVSIVMGLVAGVGLAFLLDLVDNTVKSQDDVEIRVGVPFLGIIPRIGSDQQSSASRIDLTKANKDLYILARPKSSVAECCRAIRTSLLFLSPDRPIRSMLVTSSGPQEGKSTVATNMAIVMAQSGARVLLVDTDMRRPRVHRIFGISGEAAGVSTIVAGEGTIEQAVRSTEVPGLFFLPCGPIPPTPAELLHTERFRALAAQLEEKFDRVIYDSPPLGAVTDAAILGTITDGVLLVAKNGKTSRDMLSRSRRQLRDVKAVILGCVLNDVDLDGPRYTYYRYGRYAYYGKPYGESDKPTTPGDGLGPAKAAAG
jgi:capsular exopolysaccharide synthesis family protein